MTWSTRTRTAFVISATLLLTVMSVSGLCARGATAIADTGSDTWAVMIYMDGDNDLESNCLDDMVELEIAGAFDAMTVTIMMDTCTYFEGVHWYQIGLAEHTFDAELGICSCDCDELDIECPGELNMGDGDTLRYFLEEAVRVSPADNYMLVIWDHGASWYGVCEDWSSPLEDGTYDRLTMNEIQTAISNADMNGVELDVIAFDACLMGAAEVAYELRDSASYMVGAVTTVPRVGLPYDVFAESVQASEEKDPEAVCRMLVDSYIDVLGACSGNGVGGYPYAAMSMIDLSLIDEFVLGVEEYPGGINDMAEFLLGVVSQGITKGMIEPLESQTPQIQYLGELDPFIDFGLFAEAVALAMPEASEIVEGTLELLTEAVAYHRYVTNEKDACMRTYGISIYFTVSENWLLDCYSYEVLPDETEQHFGLDLPADTLWDEFLFSLSHAS